MKKEIFILLTKEIEGEHTVGSLEEIFKELNPIYKLKTDIYDNKQRKLEILGLPYLLFFKGNDIYTKIDIPHYNSYLERLSDTHPKNIYQGYKKIELKKTNQWQGIALDDIDYNGKEMTLWLLILY